MGTWKDLKEEFSRKEDPELTIKQFAPIYLNEYCRARNKRTDCKEQVMKSVVEIVGKVKLKAFRRSDAHHYIAIRSKTVRPATVNRGIALLKNMLTFALERDLIDAHPLLGFRMLAEEKKALRVMSLEECRRLAVSADDPVISAYIGVLGETGLRKQEGLQLKWSSIDRRNKILTVEHAKGKRPRYIPLTDSALAWLDSLPRNHRLSLRLCPAEKPRPVAQTGQAIHPSSTQSRAGLGDHSRSASFQGNAMDYARRRSPDSTGIARAQHDHDDDALCPFCAEPCCAPHHRNAAVGSPGTRRRKTGQK
jgi:integrase